MIEKGFLLDFLIRQSIALQIYTRCKQIHTLRLLYRGKHIQLIYIRNVFSDVVFLLLIITLKDIENL